MPSDGGVSYHLRVEAGPYFLQLLMDGDATLKKLDAFLRKIWLECCGHLSRFSVGMTRKASQVFEPGIQLDYEYDFGSTTELTVKVLAQYAFGVKKELNYSLEMSRWKLCVINVASSLQLSFALFIGAKRKGFSVKNVLNLIKRNAKMPNMP